jgi:uncharacterized protein (TIGR02246 family)
MTRILVLAAVFSTSLTALVSAGQGEDDRSAVVATFEALRSAVNAGDAAAFLANVTDDVMLLDLGGSGAPSVGKDQLSAGLNDFFGEFVLKWEGVQSKEVSVAGNLAFHRYTAVMTATPKGGGDPTVDDGRYLDVLRRDAGGRWKLWQHIFFFTPHAGGH